MDPERQQEVWLNRLAENDTQALREIMEAYSIQLGHLATGIVKRVDIAEEIISDVFLNLWKKRHDLSIQSTLGAYLFVAVRNRSINYLKKEKPQISEIGEVHQQIPDRSPMPEDLLFKQDMEKRLEKALLDLGHHKRQIFEMSRFQGLKYTEIAEKLNLSVHTVQKHMVEVIKYLSKALKTELTEGRE